MKRILSTLMVYLCLSVPLALAQYRDLALQAFELRMNGQPYMALDLLDSALLIYPDSARIWFEKGRCLDWIKTDGCKKFTDSWTKMSPRLRKGGKCFKVACRLDPEIGRYHFWMSQNLSTRALLAFYTPWKWPTIGIKIRSSFKHARRSVLWSPQNYNYRYELVNIGRFGWFMGGNKKLARAHADTLNEMKPVYGVMANELLANRKQPYYALDHFQNLEREFPTDTRLLRELAMKYTMKSRSDSTYADTARRYIIRILELDPKNSWAVNQFFWNLPKHRKAEALPYIESYLKAVDSDYNCYKATGLKLKGHCMKSLGELSKAEKCFAEANKLNPNGNSTFISDWEKP